MSAVARQAPARAGRVTVRLALCGLLWLTAGATLGTVQAQQSAQATQTRTAGQTQAAQEQQAPAAGPALTAVQEARAQAVGRTIRCPVCQGLPITESPSDLSQSMLRDLRGQVAAGRSDDQITTYFAQRYGDTVLLDPPRRGVNLLLWAGPVVAAVLGGAWLLSYLRARERQAAPTPDAGPLADDPGDDTPDAYLAQVRAEAGRRQP